MDVGSGVWDAPERESQNARLGIVAIGDASESFVVLGLVGLWPVGVVNPDDDVRRTDATTRLGLLRLLD